MSASWIDTLEARAAQAIHDAEDAVHEAATQARAALSVVTADSPGVAAAVDEAAKIVDPAAAPVVDTATAAAERIEAALNNFLDRLGVPPAGQSAAPATGPGSFPPPPRASTAPAGV